MDRVVLLTISALSFGLGIAVYRRTPDRVWNKLYVVHAVAVSAWVFANFMIQSATTVAAAELWVRVAHIPAAIVISMCIDFVWVFPERIDFAPWQQRAILYTIGLLFATVGFSPDLYSSIELTPATVLVHYRWPFAVFGVFTVFTLGAADWLLLRKRSRLTGLQRVQVNYVLLGWLTTQAFAILTMVLLPVIWKNGDFMRWGSASYFFVIAAMAYAIAKQRLLDLRVALRRGVAYLLAAVIVVLVAFFVLTVVHQLLGIASIYNVALAYLLAGIFMGFLVVPLLPVVTAMLERTFSSEEQLQELFSVGSAAILRTLDINELLRLSARAIFDMLHPTGVSILLRDEATGDYVRRASKSAGDDQSLLPDPRMLSKYHIVVRAVAQARGVVTRDEIFRFRSLAKARPLAETMSQLRVEMVAPLKWEDELVGLVCIGPKMSEEMYQPEEIERLRSMMPLISLAMQNANLYAEMVGMKEYSEAILREMESGVIAGDAEGDIFLYNSAAERIIGLSRDEVLHKGLEVLPTSVAQCLRRAIEVGEVGSGDRFDLRRPDGQRIPVACSTSALTSTSGQTGGAVAVINDLTVIQQLEYERQEAERLGLMRVLTAGMAHEIRNPLVAIRTFAELLPTRIDDEEFRSTFLETATDEIERIDQLVRQLMMLSKPANAVAEPVDVDRVCKAVVRSASAQAESKQVELTAKLGAVSQRPVGDESRLHQAVVNLVNNALQAESAGGRVEVITEEVRGVNGNGVLIRVHNLSSYIPSRKVDEIFKPFYTEKPEGTGLGLAICQTIIEEHNGKIRVRSEPGSGTEFVIELPVQTSEHLVNVET